MKKIMQMSNTVPLCCGCIAYTLKFNASIHMMHGLTHAQIHTCQTMAPFLGYQKWNIIKQVNNWPNKQTGPKRVKDSKKELKRAKSYFMQNPWVCKIHFGKLLLNWSLRIIKLPIYLEVLAIPSVILPYLNSFAYSFLLY